jgi:ribosomal protein S18 acetylase RimI-like enzyme
LADGGASVTVAVVKIRQVRPDEWREYRAIRLSALADSPDAFGSSLAGEQVLSDDRWQQRVDGGGPDEHRVLFVAVDEIGAWIGLAGTYSPADLGADVELISMWVAPAGRGRGTGESLVRFVLNWAQGRGLATVGLWVTSTNDGAYRLYERCGFTDTGERQPLPSNPALDEVRMLYKL